MRLRMFGGTDRGMVRSANQDAYFCSAEMGIVIVSDGMGGHKGGEKASELTSDGLRKAFESNPRLRLEDVSAMLDETLQSINLEILRMSRENENLRGMGATVNYLYFTGGHVAIGHAGDSRTYLIRSYLKPDGKTRYAMWQLTIDHNVETFIERGLFLAGRDVPEGPLSERQKSRLTRGMGVVKDLKADLYYKKLEEGDVFLTCSDGLHGYVSDRDILQALATGPIAKSPERLIKLALKAGAPDNVTVVVSVAAEEPEPLYRCKGPRLDRTPYLARDPSGQISKAMPADELIRRWMAFEISNDSEVCSSMGKWVPLQQRSKLFRSYPDFDRTNVRERLDQIIPQSATTMQPSQSGFRKAPVSSKHGRKVSQRPMPYKAPPQRRGLRLVIGLCLALGVSWLAWKGFEAAKLMQLSIY